MFGIQKEGILYWARKKGSIGIKKPGICAWLNNAALHFVSWNLGMRRAINSMLGGNARKLPPYQTRVLWFFWWCSCGLEAGPVGLWAAMLLAQKAPSLLGMEILLVGIFWGGKLTPRIVWFFLWGIVVLQRAFRWWIGAFAHWGTFVVKTLCPKWTAFNMDGLRPFLTTSTSHSHIFCFQY